MKKGIFYKTLLLIIILSLIPFILINVYYLFQLKKISSFSIQRSKEGFDKRAIQSLIMQASDISRRISDLLNSSVSDLDDLSMLSQNSQNYLNFSLNHKKAVFVKNYDLSGMRISDKVYMPLYKKIIVSDTKWNHIINVEDNNFVVNTKLDKLIDKVAKEKILNLKNGEIYVSHLIGEYVSMDEFLGSAKYPEDADGKNYEGVYIFAKKDKGRILILGLDQIHIMEYVMHTLPNSDEFVDYPIYLSGNYAFLVDDQGWTIAHPKVWDIRGYDKDGNIVPPYSEHSGEESVKRGIIPFNLATAQFIHQNYPLVLKDLQLGKKGFVNTTNIGGIEKVMAYAPISFDLGQYSRYGIFGGVTIGSKLAEFHEDAIVTKSIINDKFDFIKNEILVVTFIIVIFMIFGAVLFTEQITSPIIILSRRFTQLGKGNFTGLKVDFKRDDEIGIMGREFNRMVDLIVDNNSKLSKIIDDLKNSESKLQSKVSLLEGIREFLSKDYYNKRIDEIIDLVLLTAKKIFNADVVSLKILYLDKYFKIGVSQIDSDNYEITLPIFINNQINGVFLIGRVDPFSDDEKRNFELFTLNFSKFLENIKFYSEIESEKNFIKNIFKNMINGLIFINNDGYITHINDMAIKMFLLDESMTGGKFRDIFSEFPELINLYLESVKGKKFMTYSLNFKGKIFSCSSSFTDDSKGVIMLFRDVTEKRLTDEHLKRSDRLISLGKFAAGIAHEIRNPLTGVNLLLEDIYDNSSDEDKILIRKALDEIVRLENIVSGLLDFTSPIKHELQNSSITELIESSIFFIKKHIKDKNINIVRRFDYKGELFCSQEKIKQALINILMNAVEAVDNGGRVEIATFLKDDYIFIEIEDNGCGISKENLKFIFDPFFTANKRGNGLGLSITQNIVDEHKGIISAESELGSGTKITIKFLRKF